MLNAEKLDEDTLNRTVNVLLKQEQDILRARRALEMDRRRAESDAEEERQRQLEEEAGGPPGRKPPRRQKRRDHRFDDPFQGDPRFGRN